MLQIIVADIFSHVIAVSAPGGRVEVRIWRTGQSACLIISDNGPSQASLPADAALDLARLRTMVEHQGGTLRTEDTGSGTSYKIDFPLRAVTAAVESMVTENDGEARARIRTVLARARVCLVEDQEDARELVQEILMKFGGQVRAFSSGMEAACWFEGTPHAQWPDVLICDIGLPDEDGYAVMTRIRAAEAGQGIPLARRMPAIALTGYARTEDRTQALLAGFQLHLAKPVAPDELLTALAALVDGREAPPAPGEGSQPGVAGD
jgi:ATP-binding cassette subfamily B protein